MWFDVATSQCGDQFVEACNGVPVCDVYDGNCHDAEDFFVTPTPEPFFKAFYMLKALLLAYLGQFIISSALRRTGGSRTRATASSTTAATPTSPTTGRAKRVS